MPASITLDAVSPSVVPTPTSGRTLFANSGDQWRFYVKKPDGSIELLDTSIFTWPCSPCSWSGWGTWSCADVAQCIASDSTVINEILNIINSQPFVIPTCPVGWPTTNGLVVGETCINIDQWCPSVLYTWDWNDWIPSICPTPPPFRLLQENGDALLQENWDNILL